MSVLIGHAKAFRALAAAHEEAADRMRKRGREEDALRIELQGIIYGLAAVNLEDQMRREATGAEQGKSDG